MHDCLQPDLYGLPLWTMKHLKILSLAFNFWRPGDTMGGGENAVLLSAAVTEFQMVLNEGQVPSKTPYYIVEESIGLTYFERSESLNILSLRIIHRYQ